MDAKQLEKWLSGQIDAQEPSRSPSPDRWVWQAAVIKLCDLRQFALTGLMPGMTGGANPMKLDDPAPQVARIDALLDAWRSAFVKEGGEEAGEWVDTKRGRGKPAPPRVLRGDPAQADGKLKPEELAAIESFAVWIRNRTGELGRPDPEGLRKLALEFEERFETMFPPELAALLSRVNGYRLSYAEPEAGDETTEVEPDELDTESALWSTAQDFDSGVEQAETSHDLDGEEEFAWPLYGVNFNELHYATGKLTPDGRPELTVWRHVQGQRERDRIGTFVEWLELLRREP